MVEFYKIKQKSGLTILFERRDLPLATIMIAAKLGAAYENINEKGIAHLLSTCCIRGLKLKMQNK